MGKGGGCVPSTFRKRQPAALGTTSMDRPGGKDEEDDLQQQQQQTVAGHGDGDVDLDLQSRDRDADTVAVKAAESSAEQAQATIANDSDPAAAAAAPLPRKLKIYVVYYSMYGHVEALARRMKEGIEAEGVEGLLFRVPETLSAEVLQKMQARPPSEDVPEIEGATQLLQADGFLFGFPTRYGAMAAQMKAFFDSTGGLWREQLLSGKPAGFFLSTGTQGGGQESTAWTAITQLAHHGMLYVPVGYTFGAGMFKMDEIRGGSPYGAGVFAGDGTRQASSLELSLAEHQGKYMAAIVKKLSHD